MSALRESASLETVHSPSAEVRAAKQHRHHQDVAGRACGIETPSAPPTREGAPERATTHSLVGGWVPGLLMRRGWPPAINGLPSSGFYRKRLLPIPELIRALCERSHGDLTGPAVNFGFFGDRTGPWPERYLSTTAEKIRSAPPACCTTIWRMHSGERISLWMSSGPILDYA